MTKNLKFVTIIALFFLISCGPQKDMEESSSKENISYKSSDLKYNYTYYKIVIELLLHKDRINDAVDIFTSNINYFDSETDFMNMINRARELNKFDSIMKIVNRWMEIDDQNIYAHKTALSVFIELEQYESASFHLDFLYNRYLENKNKSYIDIESILSRNIIIKNVVDYFEKNLSRYNSQSILLSYINILQKNELDQLVVSYIKDIDFKKNRILTRKYAKSLSKLNETDRAITTLEEFIESSSVLDREVSFELLMYYLKEEKTDYTISLIDKLISIDPSDDDFIFRIALLCFDNEKYSLSEKYFNILLSKSYASDNINFFLGQIDYKNRRYDEALLHYNRIQQGTFVHTKTLNVSMALLRKYNLEKALDYIDQEIKIKNQDDLLNYLSLKLSVFEEIGKTPETINLSTEILETFPNNERALYTRAIAYEKQGDIINMSKDFDKMISLNPYNSIALNAYGYSLALQKIHLDKSENMIRKALAIKPGQAAILDSLAWILYLKGSYEEAEKYSSQAYSKDQDPEIVEHYYIILLKNGNSDEAKFILEQSIKNNPTSKKLHILLDDSENAAINL
jgi:tetratricopeptide (TPR) repeat protein